MINLFPSRPERAEASYNSFYFIQFILLHEDEIDGSDEADECRSVVPMQALALEEQVGDDGEDDERHALLNPLELHQCEWTAVVDEAIAVGWHLAAVFKEGYRPTEDDDSKQRPVAAHARLLQLEMSIPSQRHKNVAHYEEQDSVYSVHILLCFMKVI